jgi:hypothetical protein
MPPEYPLAAIPIADLPSISGFPPDVIAILQVHQCLGLTQAGDIAPVFMASR